MYVSHVAVLMNAMWTVCHCRLHVGVRNRSPSRKSHSQEAVRLRPDLFALQSTRSKGKDHLQKRCQHGKCCVLFEGRKRNSPKLSFFHRSHLVHLADNGMKTLSLHLVLKATQSAPSFDRTTLTTLGRSALLPAEGACVRL